MSNSDKVVLVTGASKGIGLACATLLAESGWQVAVHYRSGKETAENFCKKYDQCKAFGADLADPVACEQLMKNIKASFGGLYAVVNNAGMTLDKLLMLTKADDFDRIFNVNMKPVFLLSKLASKMMLKKREGRIINISSVVGFKGNPGQSLYTATKGAITSFTKSVAAELAGAGITVNSVAPGFIKTAMTDQLNEQQQEAILSQIPMKKVGEPSDIANAVEFLLSEKASYITGTTIHVNGGMF